MGLVVNLFSVGGVRGALRPLCASLLIGQGTLLVEHTPGNAAAIQTDVAVAYTQPNDFIARFTNHVHTQVEELGEHFRGLESHGLNLVPEDSSNHSNKCCHGENETPHIGVEFLIVNLLKLHEQVISRGEGFGEVHVKNGAVGGCVEVSQPRIKHSTPQHPRSTPCNIP